MSERTSPDPLLTDRMVPPILRRNLSGGMMKGRVLVLRAGSGPSNSLIRSIKAGDSSIRVVGCHDDRFVLKKSLADRNHLVPMASESAFLSSLGQVIAKERIDVLMPTTDADVLGIAAARRRLPCRTFLPKTAVIKQSQDKYSLTLLLRRRGIPAPRSYLVSSLREVEELFRRLSPHKRLWCRVRKGSGSFGAIPVTDPAQVRNWIEYFQDMRGVPKRAFTLSEYLPGRDFCVQSLWKDGRLVLVKMAERLAYIDGGGPSGVSSMASLAKTAFDRDAIDASARAIRALDSKASGAFFADIKQDAHGRPCITEINAGRFASMTNLHDLAGRHNMSLVYLQLAMDERVKIRSPYDYVPGYYIARSVDTPPEVFRLDEPRERRKDLPKCS